MSYRFLGKRAGRGDVVCIDCDEWRRKRIRAGLSQRRMAERCGWGKDHTRIWEHETGRRLPSAETVAKMREALR